MLMWQQSGRFTAKGCRAGSDMFASPCGDIVSSVIVDPYVGNLLRKLNVGDHTDAMADRNRSRMRTLPPSREAVHAAAAGVHRPAKE